MGFSIDASNKITGLASGLDTEEMVEKLMKAEGAKLDRLEQKRTLLKWKQEGYREVTKMMKGFESKFLNLANSSTNFMSSGAYSARAASSSSSEYVSAVAAPGSSLGSSVITEGSMAKVATVKGSTNLTSPLFGTRDITDGSPINLNGKGLVVSVDGVEREITFDKDYTNHNEFLLDFQSKLDDAFGEGRVTTGVTTSGNLGITDQNSTIAVFDPDSTPSALTDMGLFNGQSYRINTNNTLESLSALGLTLDADDKVSFEINGESFEFTKDTTIKQMMSTINSSKAGVTMRYDTVNDGFTLTSKEAGGSQSINIANQTGNLFGGSSVIGINNGSWYGANAEIVVDGQLLTSDTNSFELDGVTYTLHKDFTAGQSATVNVTNDDEAVIQNIKDFVEAYNDMIDDIYDMMTEKREYDYEPLTDAQREEMDDDSIKNWQAMAKKGMLFSDDTLRAILGKMRSAMMSPVEGENAGDPKLFLSNIGIETGDWRDHGKLNINETDLRKALVERRDEVIQLFSQKSDVRYSRDLTSDEGKERFGESGLANRLSDVIKNYTTGLRDKYGNKGFLLEKAGWEGDGTDKDNYMHTLIEDMDTRIEATEAYLKKRENYYWKQFSALEKAMQKMNMQSTWITQQSAQ